MQITEANKKPIIKVVACVLLDKKRVLVTSRPQKNTYSDFWEFPGGKLEINENDIEALQREMMEELDINISQQNISLLDHYLYSFNNFIIDIKFFVCLKWIGEIIPLENQDLKWVDLSEMKKIKFLPSNKRILKKIIKTFS